MATSKKFYIETLGCQMNVLDSELAAAALVQAGMLAVDRAYDADIVLFNTCSVRKHAEDKVYSALGRLKDWKKTNPGGILGVMGCMAQKEQKLIFQLAPNVDFVLGPGRLDSLVEMIDQAETGRKPDRSSSRLICVSLDRTAHRHTDVLDSFRQHNPDRVLSPGMPLDTVPLDTDTVCVPDRPSGHGESPTLVRITFGCDQFCSYCIVPFVRGPEQSRPPKDIFGEVQHLARQGISKITLIGQAVNSYQHTDGEKQTHLADLLYYISDIAGIEQIDFVTNYPRIGDDLLKAVRDLPKVLKHFHVPAQSGSDTVLKRMNRHYTAAYYREMVDRIYGTIPGSTITSDFIVGFCGETDADFEQTVDLVKYCKFRNSFIFKYSERAGTKAAELYADDVPDDVKRERNNRLLAVQKESG